MIQRTHRLERGARRAHDRWIHDCRAKWDITHVVVSVVEEEDTVAGGLELEYDDDSDSERLLFNETTLPRLFPASSEELELELELDLIGRGRGSGSLSVIGPERDA